MPKVGKAQLRMVLKYAGVIGTIAMQQICTNANCTGTTGETPAVANPTSGSSSTLGDSCTIATQNIAMGRIRTETMVATPVVAYPTLPMTPLDVYREPRPTSNQDNLKLFLRLFEPNSRTLSKKKGLQWAFIMEKMVPQLLEAAFIVKEQAIHRRLDVTDSELKELSKTEEAPDDDEDVNETEEEQGTDTNN
jgi:hypothetical protein